MSITGTAFAAALPLAAALAGQPAAAPEPDCTEAEMRALLATSGSLLRDLRMAATETDLAENLARIRDIEEMSAAYDACIKAQEKAK